MHPSYKTSSHPMHLKQIASSPLASNDCDDDFKIGQTDYRADASSMTGEQITTQICDANLTYLMLAQNLIRKDKIEALFRLGIDENSATLINTLTTAQILKIASYPILLCRFRFDENVVWRLLISHTTDKSGQDTTAKLHASILMAGRLAGVAIDNALQQT